MPMLLYLDVLTYLQHCLFSFIMFRPSILQTHDTHVSAIFNVGFLWVMSFDLCQSSLNIGSLWKALSLFCFYFKNYSTFSPHLTQLLFYYWSSVMSCLIASSYVSILLCYSQIMFFFFGGWSMWFCSSYCFSSTFPYSALLISFIHRREIHCSALTEGLLEFFAQLVEPLSGPFFSWFMGVFVEDTSWLIFLFFGAAKNI